MDAIVRQGIAYSRQNQSIPQKIIPPAMTPAINQAKKAKIVYSVHEYQHSSSCDSYGREAAEKLGLPEERVFKTLVVHLDGERLVVGIIPVTSMLNMKQIARAAKAKKAVMADKMLVVKATGYVLGGVSPLGQKKKLPTFIDSSAANFPTIYVSAGRRGLDMELRSEDLIELTDGCYTDLCG
jgi:Cys-tRNA(Pro)/Cys-tRNA(Cys) deacylase